MMHYARLGHSSRLQRVFDLLSQGGEYSTRDIIEQAHVCAVSAAIAEIRKNGICIQTRQEGRIYYYRLCLSEQDGQLRMIA